MSILILRKLRKIYLNNVFLSLKHLYKTDEYL